MYLPSFHFCSALFQQMPEQCGSRSHRVYNNPRSVYSVIIIAFMNLLFQVQAGPLPDYNAQLHNDSAKQVEPAQTEAQAKVIISNGILSQDHLCVTLSRVLTFAVEL